MKKYLFIAFCLMPLRAFAFENCETLSNVPTAKMTLQDVIKLGLCRNPQTTSGYLAAESARLNKNAGYAPYLPSLDASVSKTKTYSNKDWSGWTDSASLSASYLIFDFGKRLSDLNQLTAVWRATGFDYDETVQNYVYSIIGAYYSLLNADADVISAKFLETAAQTAKSTADKKFKAGVVARADVLKANTTLASRQVELEKSKNDREIAKGKLLSLLSFPASQDIKILDMPSDFGRGTENKTIDELIAIAKKTRPDLLKATANKEAKWHKRNSRFLQNLPSITATGTLTYTDSQDVNYNAGYEHVSGTIGIRASMPIFAGFANYYGVRAAQADYENATAVEQYTNESAELDIFTAYQNYKTAQNVLTQTETLLKSATESERVTAGMYKVGKATMLDWQTVQADLADAQTQNNSAKYDLFKKRAAVALAVGELRAEMNKENK